MKQKVFIVFLAFAVMLVAGYGISEAAISGSCVTCHTMHNSQDGTGVNPSGPVDNLLNNDCIGCHTSTSTPTVQVNDTATSPAGGRFDEASAATTQHNVNGFDWTTNPEGFYATSTPGDNLAGFGPDGSNNLDCAGANGCHGTHLTGQTALEGIAGFHHGSSSFASAYRFLTAATDGTVGTHNAILGEGSADREHGTVNDTNHNIYSSDGTAGISVLCGMCHGTFHDDTGTGPLWTRHPTDVGLGNLGAGVATSYTETPFGFTNLADAGVNPDTAYTAGTAGAQVVCVSCHRAHGTAENDLLRFTYANMNTETAGNQGGCENCHVQQR